MSQLDGRRSSAVHGAAWFFLGCVAVVLAASVVLAYDGLVPDEIEAIKKALIAASTVTVVLLRASRL